MLILTRKMNEAILIGEDVKLVVTGIRGNRVMLGFEAPNNVSIVRLELTDGEEPVQESPVEPSVA